MFTMQYVNSSNGTTKTNSYGLERMLTAYDKAV